MFLSCLKATELIEKKLHFKLSFREKLQLKVHKSMCKACSNYEKQNFLIDEAIAKHVDTEELDLDLGNFKKSTIEKLELSKK